MKNKASKKLCMQYQKPNNRVRKQINNCVQLVCKQDEKCAKTACKKNTTLFWQFNQQQGHYLHSKKNTKSGKLHANRKCQRRRHIIMQNCITGLLSPKRTWSAALVNKLQNFANCDTRNCQSIKFLRIFKTNNSTNQIHAVSRCSYVYFGKHCYRRSEFKLFVRVQY